MRDRHGLTEIASKALMFRYPIEANERSISDGVKDGVQNDFRSRHLSKREVD